MVWKKGFHTGQVLKEIVNLNNNYYEVTNWTQFLSS